MYFYVLLFRINNCITNLELDHPIQLDAFRSSSPNSNGDRSDSKKRVATSSKTFEEKEKHRFQDKYESPVLESKMKIDQSRTQSNESQARAVTITSRTRSAEQKEDLISTDTLRLKVWVDESLSNYTEWKKMATLWSL